MSRTNGPKKKGSSTSAEFFSRFIHEDGTIETKTCDTCGETKEITNKNFARKNASPDGTGTTTTCRTCQGKQSKQRVSEEQEAARIAKVKASKGKRRPFEGYAVHPTTDREQFLKEVGEKVEELTILSQQKTASLARKDQLRAEINAAVLMKGDPMEGGQQEDLELAFLAFVEVVKPMLSGLKAFGEVHMDIIRCLLDPYRAKLLMCSRGVGKSTITYIYATWMLYRNPWTEQILVFSKKESHSRKFIGTVRQFISHSPLLKIMEPEDDQSDNSTRIVLKQATRLGMGQSLAAVSSKGQSGVGSRARLIIADDIETPEHTEPHHIDDLEKIVDEFTYISGPFPDAQKLVLGTPWSPYTLFGRLSRKEGSWKLYKSPLFDEDVIDGKTVYHSRWPEIFPEERIQDMRRDTTGQTWNRVMRLDLSETEDTSQPIRLSSLPVIDLDPLSAQAPVEIYPGGPMLSDVYRDATSDEQDSWFSVGQVSEDTTFWTTTVCVIDPAGGIIGTRQDDVGVVIGSSAGPNVVVRYAAGVRGYNIQDILNKVASEIQRHRCTKVVVEEVLTSSWSSQLQNVLTARGYPMTVTAIPPGGVNKFTRILNSLIPNIASGRVFVCKDVLKGESGQAFTQQLCGVRENARDVKLSKDDIVDAFARLLDEFRDFLGSQSAQHVSSALVDYEALSRLPLRRNALNEDELEAWAQESEEEYELKHRLQHLLSTQSRELQQGFEDRNLERLIKSLKADLAKLQEGFVKRSTLKQAIPARHNDAERDVA